MILSDITIKERLNDDLVITIDGRCVTEGEAIPPASFDLRLGGSFAFPRVFKDADLREKR